MTDFWKEMEQGIRCIKLVEQLLKQQKYRLDFLKERGCQTATCEFDIARMEYALGYITIPPNYKDYFHPVDNNTAARSNANETLG